MHLRILCIQFFDDICINLISWRNKRVILDTLLPADAQPIWGMNAATTNMVGWRHFNNYIIILSWNFKKYLTICLDCSGTLVDRNTPSYSFYKTFPNSVVKEMWCDMEIDNGGWIVSTVNTSTKLKYIENNWSPFIQTQHVL